MIYNPEIANQLSSLITKALVARLKTQGHVATGKGINSIETKIRQAGDGLIIAIMGEDYMAYQETGRKAGSFPPIKALEAWVKRKGLASEAKEVKSIAFAIGRNMKRIGMHSRGGRIDMSKRHFITKTLEGGKNVIDKHLFEMFEKNFEKTVTQFIKDTPKEVLIKL